MIHPRRPFDIVHLTHSRVPEDPRPRRAAVLAANAGYRVAVVAIDNVDQATVGHYRGVTIVRLKGSKRRGSPGNYLREYIDFIARVRSLLRQDHRLGRALVIHVHTLPDFLIAATLTPRRRGARVILDLHEVFPEFARAKFPGAVGRLVGQLARALELWSRRQADVVVTVNHPIARLLQTRPAHGRERVVVIHNAPAPDEFGPPAAPQPRRPGPVRLVYHGTLTTMYGVDIAVEAVALARASGIAVTLDVYGDGPAAAALDSRITALELHHAVRLHRPVAARQLPAILTAADAGIVPTRLDAMTRYALSTKLLELVHLGVPVLASRLPTYLEYFPEETAWYFQPNDPRDTATAIERFAAAGVDEPACRARAAQSAGHQVSWPVEAPGLLNLYRELLVWSPAPAQER